MTDFVVSSCQLTVDGLCFAIRQCRNVDSMIVRQRWNILEVTFIGECDRFPMKHMFDIRITDTRTRAGKQRNNCHSSACLTAM
jgi:hypothetical protein